MEYIAEILQSLPNTLLGIIALGFLIIGGTAHSFFKQEHWGLKLVSFLVMVLGFGLLIYALFSNDPEGVRNGPGPDQHQENQTPQQEAPKKRGSTTEECDDADLVCLTKRLEKTDD